MSDRLKLAFVTLALLIATLPGFYCNGAYCPAPGSKVLGLSSYGRTAGGIWQRFLAIFGFETKAPAKPVITQSNSTPPPLPKAVDLAPPLPSTNSAAPGK
ncbi:MAG: hypothetical protein Q7S45_00070 [Candidatus Curtissbacteria bacterium]|nr:hypothetical protein [Candidatus Curtissbacteria bacterium]